MELREIAPDVYACLQEDRGLGWSNSGFVNRAGGLVVDTFWDLPHTRELIGQYARVGEQPARRVVNTHHNGDHCWGNQLFAGAEIIGHRRCAEAFGREDPKLLEQVRGLSGSDDEALAALARGLEPWDFRGIEPTPPTTLVDERLDLDLDGLELRILYVGPAHTAGDVVVHVPERGVVFAGDVLFRLCTPIGWEGSFARWLEALARIEALEPEVIVPGHGPLCGVEGARELAAYLRFVRAESERAFARELPALEAAKRIDPGPYAGWTEPERIYALVERAYRELRGEPDDAVLDPVTLFRGIHAVRRERERA